MALSRPVALPDLSRAAVVAGAALVSAAALVQYMQKPPKTITQVGAEEGILGILPRLARAVANYTFLQDLKEIHDEKGTTVYLHFGILRYFVNPLILTRDPRNVEHMLKKNFDNYPKGEIFNNIAHEMLGNGIFNADGETWLVQRKTAAQMFTASRFKKHIWQVMQKNCGKVMGLLKATAGEEVNMFNLMNRFTLDSIGEIGFGADIGSLEDPSSPFLNSFDDAQRVLLRRFIMPGWKVLRFFGLGFERSFSFHVKLLRRKSRQLVRDLRQKLETQSADTAGDSFVGLFMESGEFSEEFLSDLVLNFLLAGRDTTAQAMTWCLFLLTQHPEVEAKILEEVSGICQGPLEYDQLNKMKYLEAVLSESLRLYPSVPIDGKMVLEDDTLPDGSKVPKGALLLYSAYAMGRWSEIWGEDCDSFRPERWLDASPKTSYENPVFHAGPRECLGKRLAMVEMKCVISTLLRAYKFELAMPASEVKPDAQVTIGMSSGLRCRLTPRA
ncbi:unnamed protein product [Effrenium voratum]|uniref:Cytochrome P450 n=1 Tax=Effrenium voratum TaxID=2562239 RepID=A0AA36JQF1_9DINO|nr:unnamed protein product [Effrenium voratum]CAJ1431508.1 unnamed protein product [Effrenium voratum]